jgi:hypothetical protein
METYMVTEEVRADENLIKPQSIGPADGRSEPTASPTKSDANSVSSYTFMPGQDAEATVVAVGPRTDHSDKSVGRRSQRPRSRGAPKTGDQGLESWTIVGVPLNVRFLVVAEADRCGLTIGDWLAEAAVASVKNKVDTQTLSRDETSNLSVYSPTDNVGAALEKLNRRLAVIEEAQKLDLLSRLVGGRRKQG